MKKNIIGFSLVELLVVVTIISILATIAYLYFDGNVGKSRDSKRITDLSEIEKALEVYQTKKWSFPDPSNGVDITYSGSSVAWTQGTFWLDTNRVLRVFWNEYPVDPLFENEYTYSVLNNKREYQISALRENLDAEEGLWEQVFSFLTPNKAQAAQIETAYVVWNYNGFMVQVSVGTDSFFIATPSIITRDISDTDVISAIENRKLVYHEFFNIPHSYNGYLPLDGWFNFNVSDPVIFSGSVDDLKLEQNLLDFNSRLKYIYATTPTESFERYVAVLDEEWLTSLKKFLTKTFKIPFRSYFNCKDILDDNASVGDGLYIIDSDGVGWQDPYEVYCDMTTDGWGWTRVWDNHIQNGSFSWGLWVVWAIENDDNTHEVVALASPVDGNNYALHQTGNYSSNYQITFDDPTILKQWYEVRMSMWRSDQWSWTWLTSDDTTVLWWKYSPWTIGTCTSGQDCYFQNLNTKMASPVNFGGPGGGELLTDIDINVQDTTGTLNTNYLNGWVLFDGFVPSSAWGRNISAYGFSNFSTYNYFIPGYSSSELEAIDQWVLAGWFLVSTNDEDDWDPIGQYYNMPTVEYNDGVNDRWLVQNIDHPIVNGTIGLNVDLRWETLTSSYKHSALNGPLLDGDIVLARDKLSPYRPTVILRKHGKWNILFTSGDGVFKDIWSGPTFDSNDLQAVFAASILTYAIETAAGINPKEWYAFHNRIFYNDGTFSTNGEDNIIETQVVDGEIWTKELVRSRIYKTPENFNWYIGLDANNNKDLYFTWLRLELFYR